MTVRVPDALAGAGDVNVSVTVRGKSAIRRHFELSERCNCLVLLVSVIELSLPR